MGLGYKAIGATSESSCSGGFGSLTLGRAVDSCGGSDMYANVSPGDRTIAQTIATRDRNCCTLSFRSHGTSSSGAITEFCRTGIEMLKTLYA